MKGKVFIMATVNNENSGTGVIIGILIAVLLAVGAYFLIRSDDNTNASVAPIAADSPDINVVNPAPAAPDVNVETPDVNVDTPDVNVDMDGNDGASTTSTEVNSDGSSTTTTTTTP